jgi:hypothetical protein
VTDVLDAGFRSLDGDDEPQQIKTPMSDENDVPIQTPARLNGSGKVLDPTDDPVYLQFVTQDVKSWHPLDIPRDPRKRNTVDPVVGDE